MRRKKHKHTRRSVRFYRINFGFRPPYKVLLDGNFVHALEETKRGDAKDLLFKLLGDPVKGYVTPCVMKELRSLGKEYNGTRAVCKGYALHKCGHEEAHVSAAECLLAQLGDSNPEHFFVATQDKGLQRRALGVPGGAVLFASVNGVHLETPGALQKAKVRQVEEAAMGVGPRERASEALRDLDAQRREQQQPGGSSGGGGGSGGGGPTRGPPADGAARFRRNKAKGPNPLAAKPKKPKSKQQQQPGAPAQQQPQQKAAAAAAAAGDDQQGGKRKRQRRRGRGGEGDGGGSE